MKKSDLFRQDAPEYTVSAQCISDALLEDVAGGNQDSDYRCPYYYCRKAHWDDYSLYGHLVDVHCDEEES